MTMKRKKKTMPTSDEDERVRVPLESDEASNKGLDDIAAVVVVAAVVGIGWARRKKKKYP